MEEPSITRADGNDRQFFDQMLALIATPEFSQAANAVQRIAGFDVPPANQAAFMRFHKFITEPQPVYVTAWRSDPNLEKWYHRHVNGVLGDVRSALAAAHYHKGNLLKLESELLAAIKATGLHDKLGYSSMGFGATRKLDFEYQAFILASRRALDYLSGAISSYFKTEGYSFRKLPKTIKSAKPASIVAAINDAHARHAGNLDYIMAEGRRSVRNRIAHYEFVSAGTINISQQGLTLAGGGENLGHFGNPNPEARLGDVLRQRLESLHACVDDMIDSFVGAARSAV